MPPTGSAWGVATTGVLGWIARIAAVALGTAFLIVTFVASIPILLLTYPVHVIRRRKGRPLTWIGSWITTVLATSILMGAVLAVTFLQHDKTGATNWHTMTATATATTNQPLPPPPPPPRFLRYFPGAAAGYRAQPLSPGSTSAALILGFTMVTEMIGAMIGSLVWAATWLVVSGWTGRLAGVHTVVDDSRAPA